jgi:hypothetical protein
MACANHTKWGSRSVNASQVVCVVLKIRIGFSSYKGSKACR